MDSGVGMILREARNRRRIELSEVEAVTRIRFRYLRAIEDEEWDVLPGGVYTRGFIRTYASFLGLDGERLVDEYRESVERWQRPPAQQDQPGSQRERHDRPPGQLGPLLAAGVVISVLAVAVVAIVAIPGGGEGGGTPAQPGSDAVGQSTSREKRKAPVAPRSGVTVRLAASAEVWTCLLDAKGKALVNGLILAAGAEEGPFHSGSFTVSFGNGEVKMLIDGREAAIPATASPIGYAIDSAGRLTTLEEAERPSCT